MYAGPEDIDAGETGREECLLGLSLVARESHPTSAGRIRATSAQERKSRVRAAAAQDTCELDGVVHGNLAEFGVRHRAGVGAQTKDGRVLARERYRECRAVREALMQNFFQLGVQDAELAAPDRRHNPNGGMVERVAQCVSADHPGRADNNKTCLARRQSAHDRARSSSQST
jgi:hypothetical protein